jgi:hypothetical protein
VDPNFFIHKTSDPARTKILLFHMCTAEELMAAMNPPPQDQYGKLLVPPPRSLDWTLTVSPLQTQDPVSLVLLHNTVPKTNSKQLGEAIMSSIEWSGSNIQIFAKEGLFKASLNKVVTGDNRASGQIVWVARNHYQQALPIFKKIYCPCKKNGFPLDQKLNAIPDLCSPCLTDHSSEEVIPIFEEFCKSQKDNTKELHLMKLEGSIAELHTNLGLNHPGLTLN